ncbi:MAG TPA: hypothetical protein VGR25_12180 [bacterium]|jgi:hypothetical protein|nr:hypothetical protein [bacterium]
MERLGTPLRVTAIATLLYGLSSLSPALVSSIYGYQVKDNGLLFVLAASIFAIAVLVWGIGSSPGQYGGLATHVVVALAIFVAFFLIGWVRHLFTFRTVVIPIIIDVVLGVWIWSARPKP